MSTDWSWAGLRSASKLTKDRKFFLDAPLQHLKWLSALSGCRLNEALKVLELELAAKGQEHGAAAITSVLGDVGDVSVEGVLLATAGDGDPAAYVTEYSKLHTWVDRSLDIYRVRRSMQEEAYTS